MRPDEERDRIQRRVARDTHRGLDLGETASGRLRGVGGEQRRALLEIRHVRLVGGRAPGAELLQREHELDRVEQADDARELGRSQTAHEADELGARHADVDQHPSELDVVQRHRLRSDPEIEPVRDDEPVDDVELGCRPAIHPDDSSILDNELRLRVASPVSRDEAQLGQR